MSIITKSGMDTDYDGYFGILPKGVFQHIFKIATEMLEHERKQEWDTRLTFSHQDRPAKEAGLPAVSLERMIGVWEVGDIVHTKEHYRGWWRVCKKTPKTVVVRKLEMGQVVKLGDERQEISHHHLNPTLAYAVKRQSKYRQLTGEYDRASLRFSEVKKTFFETRDLPFGFHRDIRLYKHFGELVDLKWLWVEDWCFAIVN